MRRYLLTSHAAALLGATALYHSAQNSVTAQEADMINDRTRDEEEARRKEHDAAELAVAAVAMPEEASVPVRHTHRPYGKDPRRETGAKARRARQAMKIAAKRALKNGA
jgi:hypothetical protein